MLGAFLGIGQEADLVGLVLGHGLAARAGAGDRTDRDFTLAHANQDFRAGTDQREAGQVEEIEEWRGVDAAQGAIKRDRRQREFAGEALGQHDLEDVARLDVVLRAGDHRLVFVCCHDRRAHRLRQVRDGGRGGEGFGQLAQGFVDPLCSGFDKALRRAVFRPERGDAEQFVTQPVEHEDQRGADEQHVGQLKRALRRARQFFDKADRLVAEIADETGKRLGQFRGNVEPARFDEMAQFYQGVTGQRFERLAVMLPLAVDRAGMALGAEHEVRIEAQQAVAAAHGAAFHRFQQKVAAPFGEELQSGGDRRFGIGDEAAPEQRGLTLAQP